MNKYFQFDIQEKKKFIKFIWEEEIEFNKYI